MSIRHLFSFNYLLVFFYYEYSYGSKSYLHFIGAATNPNSLITVNYSRNTTNIDDIIASKSENSNVVKGRLLD